MKETSEIYSEMKEALERKTGASLSDGGDMALRLYAVAAELYSLWVQVEWTKNQSFPQTASGEYLDFHAYARGLERTSATAASGGIRFETDEARSEDLTVPSGTVCLNAAGAGFVTTANAVIEAGMLYCLAPAEAETPGKAGNVPANSIIFMALAPVGVVRCYNPEAFSSGADGETDEALRQRVLESFACLPNGSNRAYYESEAMNTDGVSAASVISRPRGLGTVDVIVAGTDGLPSETVLSAVEAKFEMQREICVDVEVSAPTAVTVAVTATVTADDGYEFDTVAENVRSALSEYFCGELLGRDVLRAKLGYVIFGAEGVKNYTLTLPEADITIADGELPVAGTITLTEG